jgi:hypothetical protein
MRQNTQPFFALGRQLAEWRRPLDEDPSVEEAVRRMLGALDRTLKSEPRGRDGFDRDGDASFSHAAAD